MSHHFVYHHSYTVEIAFCQHMPPIEDLGSRVGTDWSHRAHAAVRVNRSRTGHFHHLTRTIPTFLTSKLLWVDQFACRSGCSLEKAQSKRSPGHGLLLGQKWALTPRTGFDLRWKSAALILVGRGVSRWAKSPGRGTRGPEKQRGLWWGGGCESESSVSSPEGLPWLVCGCIFWLSKEVLNFAALPDEEKFVWVMRVGCKPKGVFLVNSGCCYFFEELEVGPAYLSPGHHPCWFLEETFSGVNLAFAQNGSHLLNYRLHRRTKSLLFNSYQAWVIPNIRYHKSDSNDNPLTSQFLKRRLGLPFVDPVVGDVDDPQQRHFLPARKDQPQGLLSELVEGQVQVSHVGDERQHSTEAFGRHLIFDQLQALHFFQGFQVFQHFYNIRIGQSVGR